MTAVKQPVQGVGAQLNLWQQNLTALQTDSRVTVAIRQSRKARRLILQTLPPRTVEVIVPVGVSARAVAEFVQTHQAWIDRAGSELINGFPEAELRPASIELRSTGETIAIRYEAAGIGRDRYTCRTGELVLYGSTTEPSASILLLRRWLLAQARRVLKPWLYEEADRVGLRPDSVCVRLQKTRWGSCSSQSTISLNAALMLVEPELVRYLLVHELCHLQHMSHSRAYWNTVSKFDPDYREHDKRLADSWSRLPAWLYTMANGAAR